MRVGVLFLVTEEQRAQISRRTDEMSENSHGGEN